MTSSGSINIFYESKFLNIYTKRPHLTFSISRQAMPILKPVLASPTPPQQHKQPSRKGKKAWRKNVDVSEIQEGLEVVRDEVIKGYDIPALHMSIKY